jgi:hypothetical protein
METYYVSITMTVRLAISPYCEKHMKHTNVLCGQNAEFSMLKQMIHSNQWHERTV